MNHPHQASNPLSYQFHPSPTIGPPSHMSSYLASFFQNHYKASGLDRSLQPTSPFFVPTPPSSAPPTGRQAYFTYDYQTTPFFSSTQQAVSPTLMLPQNLSLRSHPSHPSPISSPSSILSGPLNSPLDPHITANYGISLLSKPEKLSSLEDTASLLNLRDDRKQIETNNNHIVTDKMMESVSNSMSKEDDERDEKVKVNEKSEKMDDRIIRDLNIPRGKEGSLKHRILRPPNIEIQKCPDVDKQSSMSAPPFDGLKETGIRFTYTSSASNSPPFELKQQANHLENGAKTNTANETRPYVKKTSNKSEVINSSYYPLHFRKGSLIRLADGKLKAVEDMKTQDFINSTSLSPDLTIDSSTISSIKSKHDEHLVSITFTVGKCKSKYTIDVPLEHPFFVFNKGWSSCLPSKSEQLFGLVCEKLQEEDICITLTKKSSLIKSKEVNRVKLNPESHKVHQNGTTNVTYNSAQIQDLSVTKSNKSNSKGTTSCKIIVNKKRRHSAPEVVYDQNSKLEMSRERKMNKK